ncbi:MAG: hypothetical protein WB988_05060 [Candidatus Nitrosopolaris sp.]
MTAIGIATVSCLIATASALARTAADDKGSILIATFHTGTIDCVGSFMYTFPASSASSA